MRARLLILGIMLSAASAQADQVPVYAPPAQHAYSVQEAKVQTQPVAPYQYYAAPVQHAPVHQPVAAPAPEAAKPIMMQLMDF